MYHVFDKTDSIYFANNLVSKSIKQSLLEGFDKNKIDTSIAALQANPLSINKPKDILPESFKNQTAHRLKNGFPNSVGFNDWGFYKEIIGDGGPCFRGMGANWKPYCDTTTENFLPGKEYRRVKCATAEDIYNVLKKGIPYTYIILTGKSYLFTHPIYTSTENFFLYTPLKSDISFKTTTHLPSLFVIHSGSDARFSNVKLNLNGCNVDNLISIDTNRSCEHISFAMYDCTIQNLKTNNFLLAPKYSILDEVNIYGCHFINNICDIFTFNKETDNVGYYNVEHLRIGNCSFVNKGSILNLYRGGKDESTMGPNLLFTDNKLENCTNDSSLINLFGVQVSSVTNNNFINSNPNKTLISYGDNVRARHLLEHNTFTNSGIIKTDKYVADKDK